MKTRLLLMLNIALLMSAYPVQAARLVPQIGPTSTPVQPMPQGTAPNYKGNINYSAPENVSPEDAGDGSRPTVLAPAQQQTDAAAGQGSQSPKAKRGNVGLLAAAILIAAGLGGYVYFRNKKA